jgi:hypothetical protein
MVYVANTISLSPQALKNAYYTGDQFEPYPSNQGDVTLKRSFVPLNPKDGTCGVRTIPVA